MAGEIRDLTGQVFGQWTVDARDPCPRTTSTAIYWLVTCTCGNESSVRTSDLISGHSRRCKPCSFKAVQKMKFTYSGKRRNL